MSAWATTETTATTLDIAADVRDGLSRRPLRLPARLFYDATGSALFERITDLPEYYLTRTETALLQRYAGEIVTQAGRPPSVIELGAGSARKTMLLLRALAEESRGSVYLAVDVSAAALAEAAARVRAELPTLRVETVEGRYGAALETLRARPGRKLVLFIGSSIGNFDPPEARALLREVREGMAEGDSLLLGTDLVKDPAIILPAYDDAAGVTARFNKNVLARINRELGADFDLDAFRHVALWNGEASRVEMYLESERDQIITIPRLQLRLALKARERIHTESSYKFRLEQADRMLEEAGFDRRETWSDARGWFALHLATARR